MYRALTWLAMRNNVPLWEGEPLAELARRYPVSFDHAGRVFIDQTDVTASIRQARIDRQVPVVARHPPVREVMRERQRQLGADGAVVSLLAPFRVYGSELIPRHGPFVLCCNHLSWLDPWAISLGVPRTVYYIAEQEAHDTPLIGPFIRMFGTEPMRRGQSDRDA